MIASMKRGAATVLVITASMFLSSIVGCSKNGGTSGGSGDGSYNLECKVTVEYTGPLVNVTVKGEPVDLTLVFYDPNGHKKDSGVSRLTT